MQLSARGAQKKRDESKKLNMYSKQWLPGDILRVFYPIFWNEDGSPDIAVGAVWGHNVSDIKGLGLHTAFIPSTTQFDENAMPIGQPDITYQFSQIARVFVNGQKAIEEANIQRKNWPTDAQRKDALRDLENKYDTKNNRNAVRPIIGRAQYYISTEVISIKMANGSPVDDTIQISSAPLSNQTIQRLYALLDDPKYAPQPGDSFFEVEWKYPVNQDKGESARQAAPAGLTAEYHLQAQFPDSYNKVQSMFDQVSKEAETIVRRATRTVDPARVRQALTQYSFLNSEALDVLEGEDVELLCKHADLVKELSFVRAISNQELSAKIDEAIREMDAKRPEMPIDLPNPIAGMQTEQQAVTPEVAVNTPIPADTSSQVAQADAVLEQLGNIQGAPTMDQLLNNTNNLGNGLDEGALGDVDFGGAP